MPDFEIPDTPKEFFMEVVPEQFGSVAEGVDDGPGSICFDIIDEGQWSLAIKGGELAVSEGVNDDTLAQVSIEGETWQEALARMLDGNGPIGGGDDGGMSNILANPQIASTLKAAQGTVKFVTTSDDGDNWFAITFGGAEPNLDTPRATLSMPREVAEDMANGEANPQELFMAGKIQIAGDMMMLMQLAPILS